VLRERRVHKESQVLLDLKELPVLRECRVHKG